MRFLHEMVNSNTVKLAPPWGTDSSDRNDKGSEDTNKITIAWLVEHGVNINHHDLFRLTPLHLACQYGKTQAARFCIQQKGDIHASDKNTIVLVAFATQHPKTFTAVVGEYLSSNETDPLIICSETFTQFYGLPTVTIPRKK